MVLSSANSVVDSVTVDSVLGGSVANAAVSSVTLASVCNGSAASVGASSVSTPNAAKARHRAMHKTNRVPFFLKPPPVIWIVLQ